MEGERNMNSNNILNSDDFPERAEESTGLLGPCMRGSRGGSRGRRPVCRWGQGVRRSFTEEAEGRDGKEGGGG